MKYVEVPFDGYTTFAIVKDYGDAYAAERDLQPRYNNVVVATVDAAREFATNLLAVPGLEAEADV